MADVFRRYGDSYREQHGASLSTAQRRTMSAIEICRTAALGGHVEQCDTCSHQRISYNSCRSRSCPKCQSLARAQWIEDRQAELLDTEYFHVVLTVPDEIAVIAYQNKVQVYDILFHAAAETLRTIALDPQHLGAEIGFFAILHTWGQNLSHHPHLHCVIPGGGLSPGGERWVACRPGFFLPVRVLSRLFRRLLLQDLEKAFLAGKLAFFNALQPLNGHTAFMRHLLPARKAEWVVYSKRLRFCELYRSFEKTVSVTMRQTHVAGERLFVDYAGDGVPVVIDRLTGEIRMAQIFVAVLGASSFTFAKATWTQALPDWIDAHVRAFEAIGGVPNWSCRTTPRPPLSRPASTTPRSIGPTPTWRRITEPPSCGEAEKAPRQGESRAGRPDRRAMAARPAEATDLHQSRRRRRRAWRADCTAQ